MSKSPWTSRPSIEKLNAQRKGTMLAHLDLHFTEITEEHLRATMPVDHRTVQPYGILHGGASATLAETLGSMAASLCMEKPQEQKVVGIELNISHLRQVTEGLVHGAATPVKIGRRIHIWQIDIYDDNGKQVSRARLTVMVI